MIMSQNAEGLDALHTALTLVGLTRALGNQLREREAGMALADLNVLVGIGRGYNLPSVLARRLQLDPPRVSRIIDQLQHEGHIVREADPTDRRLCRLRLTTAGQERLRAGEAALQGAMAELLDGLTDDERDALQRATAGLRRKLKSGLAVFDANEGVSRDEQ